MRARDIDVNETADYASRGVCWRMDVPFDVGSSFGLSVSLEGSRQQWHLGDEVMKVFKRGLEARIQSLRRLKNRVFQSTLTPRCLTLFQ